MNSFLPRALITDAGFHSGIRHPGRSFPSFVALALAFTSSGWWLLATHRVSHACRNRRAFRSPAWWALRLAEAFGRSIAVVISRSETMGDCKIDTPVFFSDRGYLIVGAKAIGARTLIHHKVTIGMTVADGRKERPAIGSSVWIGPNCVIAGGVKIGDGATLMPGSYVTRDVPAQAVTAGNPARIVGTQFDNSLLLKSLWIPSSFHDGKLFDQQC